jgi:fatty acid desaturase
MPTMTQENPYQAPTSTTAIETRAPRRWTVIVIFLVAFQTLVALAYASTTLSQWRSGEISPLVALAWASASGLLVTGSITQLFSPRLSSYMLFLAALLSGLAFAHWRPPFVLTGLLVAVCAALVSSVSARTTKG